MFEFHFFSKDLDEFEKLLESKSDEMENGFLQMSILLLNIRDDIYKQFDEKQDEWKPLAKSTREKKKSLGADMRILHRQTSGLRLRDAWLKAGNVNGNKLVFSYPVEKPYAKEHQEGIAGRSRDEAENDRLDDEFERALGRDD